MTVRCSVTHNSTETLHQEKKKKKTFDQPDFNEDLLYGPAIVIKKRECFCRHVSLSGTRPIINGKEPQQDRWDSPGRAGFLMKML